MTAWLILQMLDRLGVTRERDETAAADYSFESDELGTAPTVMTVID